MAADSDYIKIGNMMLPRNAMDYGYESPEEISRQTKAKYEAEQAKKEAEQAKKEAEQKAAARRAELEAAASSKLAQIEENIREGKDRISAYFDVLVPPTGRAETEAGEIVRAMMRLLYRSYNDGDKFYEGYGLETCACAAQYLWENTTTEIGDSIERMLYNAPLQDDEYDRDLEDLCTEVLDYIESNPDLLAKENKVDMRDYPTDMIEEDTPRYDFECELPYSLVDHISAGNISEQGIRNEVAYWENVPRDCDINVGSYYIVFYDIDRDTYDYFEETMYHSLEYLAQELTEEYGDPNSEDEYEDEDY